MTRLYGWNKPACLALLRTSTNSRQFVFQDQGAVIAATNQWATTKAGFVDCLNVELARTHGQSPLATFDKIALRLLGASKV
jgi:predicted nucleic-acid-binding protein